MKLRMVLFVLPMLAIIAWGHVYLFRYWLRALGPLRQHLAIGASVGVLVCAFAARAFATLVTAGRLREFALAGLVWAGFLLYMLLFTGFIDWADRISASRRQARLVDPDRRHVLAATVATAAATMTGFGLYRAFTAPEVNTTVVPLKGLPKALEGFTIAQLSDVHVGALIQSAFLRELVARTNAIKADITVITGDLVDGSVPVLGRYVRELQALESKRGVYFITGNHDYYSGADAWSAAVAGLGIEVLRNRNLTLAEGLVLAGVDDWSALRFGEPGYDLDRALAGVDLDKGTVLLAHQPANFDVVAARGVGLQLSGHTHGGQFFPITLGAMALWQERSHGLSQAGDSRIYVHRGCGFVGPPMRGGSPPEIAKIVLVSA